MIGKYVLGFTYLELGLFLWEARSGIVADDEKLHYPSLPPANEQTLRIGEADPDPYSSNEEPEYTLLDVTGVLAARTNQPEPTKGPTKDLFKRILRRSIQK